jgi:glucose-6-phosphate 1-epimerase
MSSLSALSSFAIPGSLSFDEPFPGLFRALITIPSCNAELFLHGGHLTRWEPAGTSPVLYLSPRAVYAHDKAIRGGIPVIFPWFGARTADITGGRTGGCQHGFARTSKWTFLSSALSGDAIQISLGLSETENEGFGQFKATLNFSLGKRLTVGLTVANVGSEPIVYEEALHTYFSISDVENIRIEGLGGVEFLDKTDNFARKRQDTNEIEIHSATDRQYLNTEGTVTIVDLTGKRKIVVAKSSSATTVVWNPWTNLSDIDADGWRKFVCVEAANASENRVTVAAGGEHTLTTTVSVEPIT